MIICSKKSILQILRSQCILQIKSWQIGTLSNPSRQVTIVMPLGCRRSIMANISRMGLQHSHSFSRTMEL